MSSCRATNANPEAAKRKLLTVIPAPTKDVTHPNVLVPKKQLDLHALGFSKSRLALPLKHEKTLFPVTYRSGELHAHELPNHYLVHRDSAGLGSLAAHIRQDLLPALSASWRRASPPQVREMLDGIKKAELAEDGKHKLQGRRKFQGIPIAIENRIGSTRSGTTPDGHKWKTLMRADYGYIEAPAKGKDGESIDVYVGPNTTAPNAFVVHQHKSDGTGHDEDKVILGTRSITEARKLYLKHYDDPKFLGPISTVPVKQLKRIVSEPKKIKRLEVAADFDAASGKL